MSFLNASLLLAFAAGAVPIVLHLMSRREPRRVTFPAVRFLTRRFESNRARIRVRRWWLLALRVLALVAVAAALAHPVIRRDVSVVWITIGLVALLGVGLLAMASVAAVRTGKGAAIGFLAAAIAAFLVALGWGGYTAASGPSPTIDSASPVAIAIVIDNSPTIGWRTSDDDRVTRIRELAAWLISRVPVSSRIAVVDRSSTPAAFSLDVAGALSKVDAVQPLQVTTPIASRIDAAVRLVRTSELENRQVVVVTDLAETTWRDDARGVDVAATIGAEPPVAVTIFDLGEFRGVNRSLGLPSVVDATPPRGTATPIVATVHVSRPSDTDGENAADGDATGRDSTSGEEPIESEPAEGETTGEAVGGNVSVTAELQLYESDPRLPVVRDGRVERPAARRVDRTSRRVPIGGFGELLLTVPPLEPGTHHVAIRLSGDDPFVVDDRRYLTLRVLPPSPLLIVGDRKSDADVLAAAIAAPFEVGDPQAEYAAERIGYEDLPAVSLDGYDAIVLHDPPVSATRDRMLQSFVQDGGRLMISLGPAMGEADSRAEADAGAEADGGAETDAGPLLPEPRRRWRPVDPGTFLEVVRADHPLWDPFAGQSDTARWSDFPVHQYWQLETGNADRVLAGFAGTGHPAIIERRVAEGSVLVIATPLPALSDRTRRWNELFTASDAWPAFVLVRQISETMSGRSEVAADTAVGEPYLARLERRDESARSAADGDALRAGESASGESGSEESGSREVSDSTTARVQLFPPGDRMPVPLRVADGDASRVAVRDVAEAGTYWIRGTDLEGGFSANLDEQATSLSRVDPAGLDVWFGPDSYLLASTREEIELAEAEGTASVSLRSPAMLLAAILFVLEQLLGNRFYRSSARSDGTSSVAGAKPAAGGTVAA